MAIATQSKSGTIAANGTGELAFSPTRGQSWIVQQGSLNAPNVGGSASCAIYLDASFITPVVAQGDAAAGDPPVPVHLGQRFRFVWTGATAGAQINATIIYDDGQQR